MKDGKPLDGSRKREYINLKKKHEICATNGLAGGEAGEQWRQEELEALAAEPLPRYRRARQTATAERQRVLQEPAGVITESR